MIEPRPENPFQIMASAIDKAFDHGAKFQYVDNSPNADDHIFDAIVDIIADNEDLSGSELEVLVKNNDVVLTGIVPRRMMIYLIEDLVEGIPGIRNFQHYLKVKEEMD